MSKPFTVKEFDGNIEINGKIGIGDDCSGSLAYGLLSAEKLPVNEYNGKNEHKWDQSERLSLNDVGRHLGCLVKDVYYTIAGGNGYVWEQPCAFTFEKNGWILRIEKKYNYNTGMPFIWKLEELKHNKKSKSSKNVEIKKPNANKLYEWGNLSPEVKKQMRDLEYQKNEVEKHAAKERKFLFGDKYNPKYFKVDEDHYFPSEETLEQEKARQKINRRSWNVHPQDKVVQKLLRSKYFRYGVI